MATRKRDRFFALFGALLFLITSSALVIAIIVNNIQTKKRNQTAGTTTNVTTTTNKETKKLEGTQLANFTPVTTIAELQSADLTPGTGTLVKPGDTVTVDYTGAVAATGIIFQSSLDSGQPVSFPLANVIKGWTNGVPGMKVGGTRRLLIPAAQAYGATPPAGSGIPANADLVFDITLHAVGN